MYEGDDGDDFDVYRIFLFLRLFYINFSCLFCLEKKIYVNGKYDVFKLVCE